jgi:hypothetical protein
LPLLTTDTIYRIPTLKPPPSKVGVSISKQNRDSG